MGIKNRYTAYALMEAIIKATRTSEEFHVVGLLAGRISRPYKSSLLKRFVGNHWIKRIKRDGRHGFVYRVLERDEMIEAIHDHRAEYGYELYDPEAD